MAEWEDIECGMKVKVVRGDYVEYGEGIVCWMQDYDCFDIQFERNSISGFEAEEVEIVHNTEDLAEELVELFMENHDTKMLKEVFKCISQEYLYEAIEAMKSDVKTKFKGRVINVKNSRPTPW